MSHKPLPGAELRRAALKECVKVLEQMAERLATISSYVLDGQHDRVRKLVAENWVDLAGTLSTASTTAAQVKALLHQDTRTVDYSYALVMMRRYLIEEEKQRPAWRRFCRRWWQRGLGFFLYPVQALRARLWDQRETKRLAWIKTFKVEQPGREEALAPPAPTDEEET